MELIKRKILREDLISRTEGPSYGEVTAELIYIPIFIKQSIKDIGIREDLPFSATTTIPVLTGETFNTRIPGIPVDDYYHHGGTLSGTCKSRLSECQTYGATQYVNNFPISIRDYVDSNGDLISNGVTQVFDFTSNIGSRYTILGNQSDPNFGTTAQTNGIYFEDDFTSFRNYRNDLKQEKNITKTSFYSYNEGTNQSNTSLSAITKLETYLGVVFPPKTKSEVHIERGKSVVLEPHLKLSEIESLDHLQKYGNGYYNIIKQKV